MNPATSQKRLGDWFFEQKLGREQVEIRTGLRFCFAQTGIDRVAGLYVSGPAGVLIASAGRDLNVTAAQISNQGTGQTSLSAGQNLNLSAVTTANSQDTTFGANRYLRTSQSQDVGSQINAAGSLNLSAGQDLNAKAAQVLAGQSLQIAAGQNVNITQGQSSQSEDIARQTQSSGFFSKKTTTTRTSTASTTAVASNLEGASVSIAAGQDLSVTASNVNAQGALSVTAGRDINVLAGQDQQAASNYSQTTRQASGIAKVVGKLINTLDPIGTRIPGTVQSVVAGTLLTRSQQTGETVQTTTTVRSSSLSGDTVDLSSGRDTTLKAAQVVADGAVSIQAGGQIKLQAAEQTQQSNAYNSSDKSGLLSAKALSFSIGTSQQTQKDQQQGTTSVVTQIASLGRDANGQSVANANVTLQAQGKVSGEGASLVAPGGDISVQGQSVELLEARNSTSAASAQTSKTTAFTLQVGSALISAAQGVQRAAQLQSQAEQSGNSRTQALASLNTAMAAYNAYNTVMGGGGANNPGTPTPTAGPTAAFTVGSSYGTSKSSSTSSQSEATSTQGQVVAGGNVTLKATGAEQGSNLILQGQTVQAGGKVTLSADKQVILKASQDAASQQSNNQSSASAVGATFALGGNQNGLSFQASANKALGNANGESTTYNNTQVQGQQVQIDSGGDTTLKGAVVKAGQVTANVGGNLNVESLQDSATYKDKQSSAGVGVSLCIPPLCYGQVAVVNVSAAKAKINSDYQSVGEQSGIKAGDGGFTVTVGGNTDLKGGAITSTQAAIDNNKNSFQTGGTLTTSELQNKAAYDAKSVSVSISTAGGGAAGFGSDSGQAASTTKAAISGIAGDTAARTGDQEAGIKPIFDAQKVKADVQLQTAVTSEFGRNATKLVGDVATQKMQDANKKLADAQTAEAAGDSSKAEQLRVEAKQMEADWGDNGKMRLAAHTVIGGLTGGASGAAGAAVGTLTAPAVADALNKAGVDPNLAKGLTALASTATGAAVGGTAGAATAYNEVMNNYLNHADASRLMALQKKANAGALTAQEAQERQALIQKDQQTTAQLQSCALSNSAQCQTVKADFAQAQQSFLPTQQEIQAWANVKAKTSPYSAAQLVDAYNANFTKGPLPANQTSTGDLNPAADWIRNELSSEARVNGANVLDKMYMGWAVANAPSVGGGITAGIIANQAASKVGGQVGAAVGQAQVAAAAAKAEAKAVTQQVVENNATRDGGIADPSKPMSASGPWKAAAELTPNQVNQLIDNSLPAGAKIVNVSGADTVNKQSVSAGYAAPFIPGSNVVSIQTTQSTQMVRVYVSDSGSSAQAGTWVMKASDIEGLTAQQIASKYSLPQVPTMVTDVKIPTGTNMQVSGANAISPKASQGNYTGDNGGGGGVQFQIQVPNGQRLNPDWFTNERALK